MKKAFISACMAMTAVALTAQVTPTSQMEKLDRALVALPAHSGSGNFVSWRLLGTDTLGLTTFDVRRDGSYIGRDLIASNMTDAGGWGGAAYEVIVKKNGEAVETLNTTAWYQPYLRLSLKQPADGINESGSYTYSPNDCSVGDVDGDGQYELFVKWDPSNAHDNAHNGYTGNVFIDCYRLDGTFLWRIDLGRNIRAGAHYTQYMVYDFDGDGRAELICKTAPGSKDGRGSYVNQATDDARIKAADNTAIWLNGSGRMDGGHEYLTVFEGMTGKAVNTIPYNPTRNARTELSEADGTFNWAVGKTDNHGYNRGDRYLAAVAYLDGPEGHASGIFCRGYYSYAYVWAVDYDGERLRPRWLHRSDATTSYSVETYDAEGNTVSRSYTPKEPTSGSGSSTLFGNGNHNLSVGDVDGDGRDEIVWGSATLDDNGRVLMATGFGHGDAIHMGRMIPGRKGLQVFQIHEEKGPYAWDLHDAATGEVLIKGGPEGIDNGRGIAAQLSAKTAAWWFASAGAGELRSCLNGEIASQKKPSMNFRIYWDGTLQDALLDGNVITKYNDASDSFSQLMKFSTIGPSNTCNGTKNTPNLQADILGDWREEVILWRKDGSSSELAIYTTNHETQYAIPTLMHDHTYRMAVAWQNTAYNQPPHLGYNLAESTVARFLAGTNEADANMGEPVTLTARTYLATEAQLSMSYMPGGKRVIGKMPDGFEEPVFTDNTLTIKGIPAAAGDYRFVFKLTGPGGNVASATVTLHVTDVTGISAPTPSAQPAAVYDLQGRRRATTARGLNIVREGGKIRKVLR